MLYKLQVCETLLLALLSGKIAPEGRECEFPFSHIMHAKSSGMAMALILHFLISFTNVVFLCTKNNLNKTTSTV